MIAILMHWALPAGLVAWPLSGFIGYAYWEMRHLRHMEKRYPRAGTSYFPAIGPGLFMMWFGPFIWALGLVTRPVPVVTTSAREEARASRMRPDVVATDHDEFHEPLEVVK